MSTLLDLCTVRDTALNENTKDDVLEIINLFKGEIDAERFFTESFFTEGINTLLTTAFLRFAGKDDHGIIKLTQNMGGGKTHSMITLGLLAKHPEYRERFLGNNSFQETVRVVGFSGRQSDTELGIWGEIAKQLGKEEEFKSYYNPQFRAPGHEAWVNLLKSDQPTLILLDELPPYLVNAKSISVGNSDLSQVSATALANLFNALKENELSNVMVVISDLTGNHAEGSDIIQETLKTLRNELSRVSLNLTPVSSNSNELVEILKTKLFSKLPPEDAVKAVAEQYKQTVTEAKQMGLTNTDPATVYSTVIASYPFHPSFIDLYNRFKENEGFQQTRGVIRLVRAILRDLRDTNSDVALISPQDINLSNATLRTAIEQLNPNLTAAIRHDVNASGEAVAEQKDKQRGGTLVQDLARLLLVSSLSSTTGGLKGLNQNEIVTFVAKPSIKVQDIKPALEALLDSAWYISADKDGRFYFQRTQNLIAQLNSLVDGYDNESARREIKKYLEAELKPSTNDCYQKVQVFPALDELDIDSKKVTLIVTEPSAINSGITSELIEYWNQHSFKNRFLILSGERQTWESLITAFKEYKAIQAIITSLKEERIAESDPQFKKAQDKEEKIKLSITSAIRETFVTVYFPLQVSGEEKLEKSDITFQFNGNVFNAEEQITKLLKDEYKFTADIENPAFRTKIEEVLFGAAQKEINWEGLKDNAARNCRWVWHHPNALESVKKRALTEGVWRDNGGYIERGPFPKEPTNVDIKTLDYDRDTQETVVKISAKYGDKVYMDTNENVSESSKLVENPDYLRLKNFTTYFICVDSKGEHETGATPVRYDAPLKISHRFFDESDAKKLELQVNCGATIHYTTDGADPRSVGGIYEEVLTLSTEVVAVRVAAKVRDVWSDIEELQVPRSDKKVEIDDRNPYNFAPVQRMRTSDNNETFTLLEELESSHTKMSLYSIEMTLESDKNKFLSVNISEGISFDSEEVRKLVSQMRVLLTNNEADVRIELAIRELSFESGTALKQYASNRKINLASLQASEVKPA